MNESTSERARMVVQQLESRGVHDPRVLAAMAVVPRERFVPQERRIAAYEDRALPLSEGQTISQPFMVARTCELAQVDRRARVLDVGTGSGYQAAILAELAAEVVTIERIPSLAQGAERLLNELGYRHPRLRVVVGDGTLGYLPGAPYDAILVAAAAPRVPLALAHQLAVGGRLVLPVGTAKQQWLTCVHRVGEAAWRETRHEACVYVPLIGEDGFDG